MKRILAGMVVVAITSLSLTALAIESTWESYKDQRAVNPEPTTTTTTGPTSTTTTEPQATTTATAVPEATTTSVSETTTSLDSMTTTTAERTTTTVVAAISGDQPPDSGLRATASGV